MPDHPKALRHVLQLFGDILAEMAKAAAALRAAALFRLMRDDLAGQMLGQRPASRLGTLRLSFSRQSRRERRVAALHLFQLKFQLVQFPGELLASVAEQHAAQLLHHQLQMFDLFEVGFYLRLVLGQPFAEYDSLLRQFLKLLLLLFIQPLLLFVQLLLLSVLCVDQCLQRGGVECIQIRKSGRRHPRQYATLL